MVHGVSARALFSLLAAVGLAAVGAHSSLTAAAQAPPAQLAAADVAQPETMPRQEGNQMHTILTAKKGAAPKKAAAPKAEGEEVKG